MNRRVGCFLRRYMAGYNGPSTPTVQIPARYRFPRFSGHKYLLDMTKVHLGSTRFTVLVFKSSSHFGPGAPGQFNVPDTWKPLELNKLTIITSTPCRLVWSAPGHVCIVGDSSQHILIYSVSNIHLFPRNFLWTKIPLPWINLGILASSSYPIPPHSSSLYLTQFHSATS